MTIPRDDSRLLAYVAMEGTSRDVRINLGSGTTAPAGWINLDRSPGIFVAGVPGLRAVLRRLRILSGPQAETTWASNVRRHDVTRGLPFPDGFAEAIYASHLLEHLPRDAAVRLVQECRRVLRPHGVLRLALPDLRAMAERYVRDGEPGAAHAFVRATGLGVEQQKRRWARLVGAVSGAQHKWMYDERSTVELCRSSGFAQVTVCRYRIGRCPDLAGVEHRKDSIFVEAY